MKNQDRILITPYEVARLRHLTNEKRQETLTKPALTEKPTNEEQLEYAGGILMHAPTKIANQIISFLPHMNNAKATNILKAAEKKKTTTQNNEETEECKKTNQGSNGSLRV